MSKIILPPKPKNPVLALPKAAAKKRRSKAEWLERFAAVPVKPSETAEEAAKQRALFERHDEAVIRLRLPMPPSVNHYWRTWVRPGSTRAMTHVSNEGQAYRAAVKHCLRNNFARLTGRLRVLLLICYCDRRKIDLDNRTKAVLDALTDAGLWIDDSQIDSLRVERGPVDPTGAGYCDVVIETISV